jgi:hypothetical protein
MLLKDAGVPDSDLRAFVAERRENGVRTEDHDGFAELLYEHYGVDPEVRLRDMEQANDHLVRSNWELADLIEAGETRLCDVVDLWETGMLATKGDD